MWQYEKRLIRPVKVQRPDPAAAVVIMSQLGGPHSQKL
ncbi:MAG TPA: manganese catalase family protein [Candidatus Merdivicinus faecavium]|nr:manganese catalase family protein [Candidatus Merdivicinus faecavium]